MAFREEIKLEIEGYYEDVTENKEIGRALVMVGLLGRSGRHMIDMIGNDGQSIGIVSFSFEIVGGGKAENQPI